jgi:sulfur transfer complex TusBCD TusB component (DsrH family)
MEARTRRIRHFPPSPFWREALLLIGVSLVLAAASWFVRTPRVPLVADMELYSLDLGVPVITPADAVPLFEAGVHMFVDTRADAADLATIPGCFIIRQDTFDDDLREVFDFLHPDDPLILYGDGNLLMLSPVLERLKARGYTDMQVMRGDPAAFRDAGGELSPGPEPEDAP